ncbi:hypothetical protein [Kineococcus sp. SYSU DK003]|uniref:hypothetical protein n=1 Tax=Kineococcus sp. SYSU DK003 TaxID=3383124 RepID=UPI003D7E5846
MSQHRELFELAETAAADPADTVVDMSPRRSAGGRVRGAGRDRLHSTPRRRRSILLRYTDEEYRDVATAARLAGLTATGFVAETALAAARRLDGPSTAPIRAALVEVMSARTQVRRFAVNVNQAVTALHGTGQPPAWLAEAVAITTRAVGRLDDTAQALAEATRQQRPPRPRGSEPGRRRDDQHEGETR